MEGQFLEAAVAADGLVTASGGAAVPPLLVPPTRSSGGRYQSRYQITYQMRYRIPAEPAVQDHRQGASCRFARSLGVRYMTRYMTRYMMRYKAFAWPN
jgi:hypothetical protein